MGIWALKCVCFGSFVALSLLIGKLPAAGNMEKLVKMADRWDFLGGGGLFGSRLTKGNCPFSATLFPSSALAHFHATDHTT